MCGPKMNSAMGHILRSVPSESDAVVLRLQLNLTSPFAELHPKIALTFFFFKFFVKSKKLFFFFLVSEEASRKSLRIRSISLLVPCDVLLLRK